MAGRLRLLTVLLVVAAFVLVPFALWGDQMDAAAPALLSSQTTRWAVALLGVSLLVVDVLVPIPTSVVSVMLCVALGFPWGMAAVFAGMVGAFVIGHLVGRVLPTERLREWVGPVAWDTFAARKTASLAWVAASRPIPVLAEASAVMSGSFRVPFLPALAAASSGSALVSAAYGLAVRFGVEQSGSTLAVLVVCACTGPVLGWLALTALRRPHAGRGVT